MRNSFEIIPASENNYYFSGDGANFASLTAGASERLSVSLLLPASVEFRFAPLDSYLHNA
jgi:hypothetical protein